jgi:general secretion pathway protein A
VYQKYWGLNRSPFALQRDHSHLYRSGSQDEALLRLHYLVDHHRRLGVLLGRSGTGKSALLEQFAAELAKKSAQVAVIQTLGLDVDEFLWELADNLGLPINSPPTRAAVWRAIFDNFLVNQYQQVHTVLLLDDVDDTESDVLTSIVRLAQWAPATEARVTVVITADTEQVELLGRRLLQLCDLQVEIAPWEQEDTFGFLRQALRRAGREQPVFDDHAIEVIHELSQGVPRRVRQLGELALIAGAGQQLDLIDADTVRSVSEELSAPNAMSVY